MAPFFVLEMLYFQMLYLYAKGMCIRNHIATVNIDSNLCIWRQCALSLALSA